MLLDGADLLLPLCLGSILHCLRQADAFCQSAVLQILTSSAVSISNLRIYLKLSLYYPFASVYQALRCTPPFSSAISLGSAPHLWALQLCFMFSPHHCSTTLS